MSFKKYIYVEDWRWKKIHKSSYCMLKKYIWLWFRYFSYLWVGSAISFFEVAEAREKADLQVVALKYKYWERN